MCGGWPSAEGFDAACRASRHQGQTRLLARSLPVAATQRRHPPSRRQQDAVAHGIFVALVAVHGRYIGVGADHPESVDPHFLGGLQEFDGQHDVATVAGGCREYPVGADDIDEERRALGVDLVGNPCARRVRAIVGPAAEQVETLERVGRLVGICRRRTQHRAESKDRRDPTHEGKGA